MRKLFCACLVALLYISNVAVAQNDHIFPAAAAAQPYINFDARGFLINGKRTFICSGGIEYARMPRELWADRLMRLKMAGYNCVEMYTFWNFHEPVEGQFDFSGNRDLDAFLKLIKKMGMYAIVRVGPYYCAEWNFGGYPIWLSFKNNLLVREPNAAFQSCVDSFFDKLIPIVSNNQINNGGSVILVQLENEHPAGWGTDVPNSYFAHLQSKALSLGLQVPYFFSGLHHSGDPAGSAVSLDDTKRPNPFMSTEFWTINTPNYGETEAQAEDYERRNWKLIAHGGNGYNHYMAYGGSNFDYDNNDEDGAAYDYGSPVGQTGDLRPMYYYFKKESFFARSFADILENSLDATSQVSNLVSNTAVKATARQSPAGSIIFLDNQGTATQQTQINLGGQKLPTNGPLNLQAQEIMPVVCNYQLTTGVKMEAGIARIMGISKQGTMTTLVTYGAPNDAAQLVFSSSTQLQPTENTQAFAFTSGKMLLSYKFPSDAPVTYVFKNGNESVRVIAMSTALADRTWLTDVSGVNLVITGPEYVSGLTYSNNTVTLKTEHEWQQTTQYPTWVWGEKVSLNFPLNTSTGNRTSTFPLTDTWQVKNASYQAGVNFDDSGWLKSDTAQFMGADNDITCDAWYRTQINVQQAGTYRLSVTKGTSRAIVFIDSNRVVSGNIGSNFLQFPVTTGKHTLAVFTAHDGRSKLFGYLGNIQYSDPKGMGGNVTLVNTQSTNKITSWRVIKASGQSAVNTQPSVSAFASAPQYTIGNDAFGNTSGYAWFGAVIPVVNGKLPHSLVFETLDDIATVFVNGKQAAISSTWMVPCVVNLDGLLSASQTNYVTVFVQNTGGAGGITKPVDIYFNDGINDTSLKGWSLKGGPGDYSSPSGWSNLTATASFGRPTYYQNSFNANMADSASKPIYRVISAGLGHGNVWVNGHNLGRYPEHEPINGLYIPECWLVNGANSVVIYDEDGSLPTKVSIQAEVAASRDVTTISYTVSPAPVLKTAVRRSALNATLSPNPSSDTAKVTISNAKGLVSVKLLDMGGNKLWESAKTNLPVVNVPVENLRVGVYVIVVTDEQSTKTLKLTK